MRIIGHCRFPTNIALIIVGCAIAPTICAGGLPPAAPAPAGNSETTTGTMPARAIIEQVQASQLGRRTEVKVIGSRPLSCTSRRLTGPNRLVFDCAGAHAQIQRGSSRIDLWPVRSIRVGQFKPTVARVVIDTDGKPTYKFQAKANVLVVTFDPPPAKSSTPEPAESVSKGIEPTSVHAVPSREDQPGLATRVGSVAPPASEIAAERVVTAETPSDEGRSERTAPQSPSGSGSGDTTTLRPTDGQRDGAVGRVDPTSTTDDYVIGTQDLLAINVWHEPELSRTVPVRPDGKISLPLLGDISVGGLTPRLLQDRLTQELESYIRKPQVTVIVQEVNSHKFYILGLVERPGSYSLAAHVTILDALAMAGGFRDFAKVSQIYLLRLMPDGSRTRTHFDYKAAVSGNSSYQDIDIQTGDTLVVP